jgi:hypothetical protein
MEQGGNMNIHRLINFKGLQEYYNTPEKYLCNFKKIKYYRRGIKPVNTMPLIYYSLYVKYLEAMARTFSSVPYYCPDCQTYHYPDGSLSEFIQIYQKHIAIINKIREER